MYIDNYFNICKLKKQPTKYNFSILEMKKSDTENLPKGPNSLVPGRQSKGPSSLVTGVSQKTQVLRWTEDQVQELCYKVTMADNKLHIKKC